MQLLSDTELMNAKLNIDKLKQNTPTDTNTILFDFLLRKKELYK